MSIYFRYHARLTFKEQRTKSMYIFKSRFRLFICETHTHTLTWLLSRVLCWFEYYCRWFSTNLTTTSAFLLVSLRHMWTAHAMLDHTINSIRISPSSTQGMRARVPNQRWKTRRQMYARFCLERRMATRRYIQCSARFECLGGSETATRIAING